MESTLSFFLYCFIWVICSHWRVDLYIGPILEPVAKDSTTGRGVTDLAGHKDAETLLYHH